VTLRGSQLSVSVQSETRSQSIVVVYTTFDTLTDPCGYLLNQLSSYVREEVGAPSSSTFTCSLISSSVLSNAKREYRWNVTTTWTV